MKFSLFQIRLWVCVYTILGRNSLEVNIKPNHGTLPILNWNPGEIYLQKDIESLDRTRSERDDKLLWAYVKSWSFVLFGTLFDKDIRV